MKKERLAALVTAVFRTFIEIIETPKLFGISEIEPI